MSDSDSAPPAPLFRLTVSGLDTNDSDLLAFRDFLQREFGGEAVLREHLADPSSQPPQKGWPEVYEAGKYVVDCMECALFINDVFGEDKLRLMATWNALLGHLKTLGQRGKGLVLYYTDKSVSRPHEQTAACLRNILATERPRE